MTTFTGLPGATSNVLEAAWGDYVDPLEFLRDDPNFGIVPLYSLLARGDRDNGQDKPALNTETDLDQMRAIGRNLVRFSPAAICATSNLLNYVIGKGYTYTAMPEKEMDVSPLLLKDIQRVIDRCLDDNDFCNDLDRELYLRSIRDGERFTAIYPIEDSVQFRVVEPELVREPQRKESLENYLGIGFPSDWTFGVHTRRLDIQKPLGYYVQWDSQDAESWEYFTPQALLHGKRNVDRNVKRGISDLYPVKQWLDRAEKVLGNTADGASIQAAIAFIREHVQGATPSQVSDFVGGKLYRQYQEQTPYGSQTRNQVRYKSGTVLNIPAGQQYKYGPMGQSSAPVYMEVEQAVLRYVGMRWSMPEYMVSSDASNGNYASTLVAESPFVKFAESEQKRECKYHLALLWAALKAATEAGRFSQYGVVMVEQLHDLIEIQAEPPMVASRNAKEETERRKVLSEKGILSDSTWAAQEGLDYEEERAKGAEKELPPDPFGGEPNGPPKQKSEPADVAESLSALVEDAFKVYDA